MQPDLRRLSNREAAEAELDESCAWLDNVSLAVVALLAKQLAHLVHQRCRVAQGSPRKERG